MASPVHGSRRDISFWRAAFAAGEVAFASRAAMSRWTGVDLGRITHLSDVKELTGEGGWRLASLLSAVTMLLAVYEPHAIRGWLEGSNPHLNGRRPLDVLARGDVAAVISAVQAARTGAPA